MNRVQIELPNEKIADFCRKWQVRELSLFGSVLTEHFGPDSDIDVLVDFQPTASHGLFDLVSMQDELQEILGRKVDLLTRRAVEDSRNYIRRKAILSSLEVVHVS
jgi:predicted nucleotidyltransferase